MLKYWLDFFVGYFIYQYFNFFFQIGGGLDTKSGIFTAPIAGAYLFIVHVCSADMSKALLAIR